MLGTDWHDEDVLGELGPFGGDKYLAPWREGKPAKVLQRNVEKLAEKYGAPYKRDETTLFAWLALFVRIDIHHTAVRALNTHVGGYEVMLFDLENRYKRVKDRMDRGTSKTIRGRSHPTLYLPCIQPIMTKTFYRQNWEELAPLQAQVYKDVEYIFLLYEGEYFEPNLDELELMQIGFLIDTALKVKAVEELDINQKSEAGKVSFGLAEREEKLGRNIARKLREEVANGLLASFSEFLNDTNDPGHRFTPTPDGLVLECPVGLWVDLQLAELWRNDFPLQACEQCGALFAPLHGGTKYCKGGGCRDQSYRERRAKAKQERANL